MQILTDLFSSCLLGCLGKWGSKHHQRENNREVSREVFYLICKYFYIFRWFIFIDYMCIFLFRVYVSIYCTFCGFFSDVTWLLCLG